MALYIGNKKYCAVINGSVNNKDTIITANGNYTAEEGYSGFGLVRVQVPDPVLDNVTINPSTTTQTLNSIHDGYATITVNPVTAAIDSDIKAANIKKGVNILGVTGTLEFTTEELTVTPTTAQQIKTPTKNGYSKVTVGAVTSAIDSNIKAGNIKSGTTILGVTGTLIESKETTRNINANGTFTPGAGYTGFSSVVVDVEAIQDELNITPSTTAQTFTAVDAYHGYSPVNVAAVTASIDTNIKAANIKSGITILGVTGTLTELKGQTKTVTPTTADQTITPDTGYNGLTSVTVNKVTSAIDSNIKAANIKSGVTILGVTGTCTALNGQTKTVTPTTSQQTITPDASYNALTSVTVNAVTSAIDTNIKAANIKQGVSILGVAGTCVELKGETKTITANGTYTPSTGKNGFTSVTVNIDTVNNQTKTITANGTYTPDTGYTGFSSVTVNVDTVNNTTLTVTPSKTAQTKTPSSPYTGFSSVMVNAVTASIDSNIKAENIKSGVTILGVTGTLVSNPVTQTKTLTVDQNTPTYTTFTPDDGYDGFNQVVVDLTWVEEQLQALNAGDSDSALALQNKTITSSGTFTPDTGYDGFGTITVDLSAYENQIRALQARIAELEG